ncbi:sugar kinase [Mesorhizobium sp.]|uniref:sugar kinase n=1 Tax=Mesorhizobium sp. TaxID=1871066 RepID=UPI000FE34F4B|nr:sugar kinase [Mesorhizobium sp.]RWH72598.1 MAG: sugar kinase [Mesorhizobium sp.]RWL34516.1 MAG: sugar kinase [Mesorhizobium sp.]RWL35930.1 MAG: sugar kinase [Mesorhizobium sp.]RWL41341.1 MAG: sugar kinase [Mesorhizobium sp.]RWL59299.1 MAG: sugar kinase [Mesorhizobium sp.]
MKKLVSAGEILVEIMADRIGQSFLEPGPLVGPFPSGAPAIFIGQAAALGQPAGLIGAVGEDDFGQLNIDRLRALGADVSAITSHKGHATGTAFVTYLADASRHFVFNIRDSAAGLMAIDDAARHLLADADHFHVMGSSLFSDKTTDVVLAATAAVKARGGTVSFDPNVRHEIMQDSGMREALDCVLAQTDVFLPSGNELLLFSSAGDEQGAIAELLGRGIACIVLKRGADGAVYHDRQNSVAMPGFAVEEVDPTGAGDCFGAAFVSFWLRGAAPAEALRIANACGALAVTRKGPMEGIHRLADVEAFMARAGRPA